MVWVTEHPPLQVDLDSCVTCGLCLPVCPTFRLTGDETASPRGRLTAISAVAQGVTTIDARFDEVTSFCLQCRACETVCPSMVPFGSIIESARSEAVAQVPRRDSGVRRFLLSTVLSAPVLLRIATLVAALGQRLRLLRFLPIVGRATRGLRPLPLPLPSARGGSWPAASRSGGSDPADDVVLFTGCVADAWFSGLHVATIEVLSAAGYSVRAPASQTCCGALASHGGFERESQKMALSNIKALSDDATVVVNVAGCGAHLKQYGRHGSQGADLAARTADVTEFVSDAIDAGRLPKLPSNGERVAIQDPCHLEHGQGITVPPRAILEAAGYEVVDVDPGGLCCGAAGLYQVDHPETSEQLGSAKAQMVRDTGVTLVASANAGCEMQLRRYLDDRHEVLHPVEIYARAIQANPDVV
ncbi:MAG: glycolate oxidase subunit GlcF [Acidimicrobiia bacterium]|nr:MAG: glycolate oxidase subunit GlcF [Acidimicrobiia bacterium]